METCAFGLIICAPWFCLSAILKVGSATCLYTSTKEVTFLQELQSVSMTSDFFAGIMTAWQLDGVKFAFAQSIVTTRQEYRRLRRL